MNLVSRGFARDLPYIIFCIPSILLLHTSALTKCKLGAYNRGLFREFKLTDFRSFGHCHCAYNPDSNKTTDLETSNKTRKSATDSKYIKLNTLYIIRLKENRKNAYPIYITVTSHECHSVWNHEQIVRLMGNLFRLRAKKIIQIPIY